MLRGIRAGGWYGPLGWLCKLCGVGGEGSVSRLVALVAREMGCSESHVNGILRVCETCESSDERVRFLRNWFERTVNV